MMKKLPPSLARYIFNQHVAFVWCEIAPFPLSLSLSTTHTHTHTLSLLFFLATCTTLPLETVIRLLSVEARTRACAGA